MRDYTNGKEKRRKQENFIVGFKEEKDGTITIKFANGDKYKHIAATPENLRIIREMLDRQVERGLACRHSIKEDAYKSVLCTTAGTSCSLVIGTIISAIPVFDGAPMIAKIAGVGAVTIASAIPLCAYSLKKIFTSVELDMIKYVEDNHEILYRYKEHPNALAGLSSSLVRFIKSAKDPFCYDNIDKFTLTDLKTIVANIRKENATGLNYSETQAVPKKKAVSVEAKVKALKRVDVQKKSK